MLDEVVNFLVPYEVPKKVQMWPVASVWTMPWCGQRLFRCIVEGSTLILPASH